MDSSGNRVGPASDALCSADSQPYSEGHLAYFEHAPLSVMVVDADGRYVHVNPAACRISGYDEAELLKMSLADLLAEESVALGGQHFRRLQELGQASDEFCWIRKDGSRRWSTCDAVKLSENRFIAFMLDITDRKNAEVSLASAHRLLTAILDAVPDLLIVIDRQLHIQYTNARGHDQIVQTDPEKYMTCYGRFKLLDGPCDDCSALPVFETGGIVEREMLNPVDRRYREVRAFPIFDDAQRVEAVVEYVRDVTERKRAEAILLAERDLAQQLLLLRDPQEIARICLDSAMTLTGFECGGVYLVDFDSRKMQLIHHLGLGAEFISSETPIQPGSVQDKVLNDGQTAVISRRDMEQSHLHSLLREGLSSAIAIPLRSRSVTIACLNLASRTRESISTQEIVALESIAAQMGAAIAHVHTDRLRRQSEERYRLLVEASPCSILVVQDGRYAFGNPYAEEMLGYPANELAQVPVIETIHPDSREVILRRIQAVERGKPNPPVRIKVIRKDGIAVDSETVSVPIMFNDRPAALVVGQDISARLQAEDRVRQLAELLDAAPTSTTVHDANGRFLYANEKTFTLHGLTREEFFRQNLHQLDAPDSAQHIESRIAEIAEKGEASFEVRHHRKSGPPIPLRVDTKLAQWGDQQVFLSVASDISDLKRTEQTLREREARLQGILDAVRESLLLVDREGNILECNETAARRLGYPADALLGESVYRFLPPDVAGLRRNQLFRVFQSGQPIQFEDERAGTRFEHTLYPVIDDSGNTIECAIFGRDITQRKQAEESLRQSEEHYRVLAETMLQGVVHQDQNGTIIAMNPAAERVLGKSPHQFLGSSSVREEVLTIREDGSPFPGMEHPAMVALRTGQQVKGVVMGVFNPAVQDYRWISVDAVPLFRPGETRPHQVYTVFEDITGRKRAEEEKLEMERRLLHAQKLASLGILAGGIAHDFNNILAGIMGYADLLKARLSSAEPAREDIDVIKKAVQRAADLTRQMLAYAGKGQCIIETVDLSQIVRDTQKMLAVSVSKKAALTYYLASDLPSIQADPSQLHQIILNLVINASESLGENVGVITVATRAIALSREDCAAISVGRDLEPGLYVCLEIADTGCGMDHTTQTKIFDPFFTTKFTGRGLGLAAVHGIVRSHRAGLRVASEVGDGTTFQVYFPAASLNALTTSISAAAEVWRGTGTVLVVDDEQLVRNMARQMLEHLGFSVLIAVDGEDAIDAYQRHQSDVTCILLDLTMPKLSGTETLQRLLDINAAARIVLTSGFAEDSALEGISPSRLAGFIQKPYQLERLADTLQKALIKHA